MRLISQSELLRATKLELNALLRRIAADLPSLPEGSHELRIAHYNLHNIHGLKSQAAPASQHRGASGMKPPRTPWRLPRKSPWDRFSGALGARSCPIGSAPLREAE
jgi:hypothetical protein